MPRSLYYYALLLGVVLLAAIFLSLLAAYVFIYLFSTYGQLFLIFLAIVFVGLLVATFIYNAWKKRKMKRAEHQTST